MKLTILVFAALSAIQCSSIPETAAPVQLLNLSSGNKSDILYDQTAVKNLFLDPKLSDRNVVVFSIVGAFRKGKSFLMNYVLRYLYAHFKSVSNENLINADDWLGDENEPLTGFEWKSGTSRVTSGLILWSDVFLYDDPKGEKFAIYLMDTQGLFDHQTTSGGNSKIFSLSTLISSMQILNLFNIIQEDHLQYLQFATEYARYASADDEKAPFQNLMILIRDWNSPQEYKYGIRGGNAYLTSNLEIHDHQKPELQSVRRYLRSSFEKIDCFLMPHPGRTVATDSNYDGNRGAIDEDFIVGMEDLFKFMFSPKKLSTKKVNGAPIKPAELLVFINNYVENFKNENLPEAMNLYESTLDQQFQILMGKSVDKYIEAVASHGSELLSEDDINQLHADSKAKSLKYFSGEKKFGTHAEGNNFKKQLEKKLEVVFGQWKAVTLNELRKLQIQKEKTNQQIEEAQKAQVYDDKAKQEMEEAIKKAEEARKALEQARYDTEEARKEAKELMEKSQKAEAERAEAIGKEKETREWLDKMTRDKEFYEQEYNKYREQAAANVGQTLGGAQQENGFTRVLGSITNFVTAAAPLIGIIGGLFG